MNHDTIVMVCKTALKNRQNRINFSEYIGFLKQNPQPKKSLAKQHVFIWGDQDFLYPNQVLDEAITAFKNTLRIDIPGGRHLHPIERPWALADEIYKINNKLP